MSGEAQPRLQLGENSSTSFFDKFLFTQKERTKRFVKACIYNIIMTREQFANFLKEHKKVKEKGPKVRE